MVDVDAVWNSLKSEDGKSFQPHSILQNLPAKENYSNNKKKQQINALKKQAIKKHLFDIDSFHSGHESSSIRALSQPSDFDATLAINLSELAAEFSELNYDSDDDVDEEYFSSDSLRPVRTERLANVLHSNNVTSQAESLAKLSNVIKLHLRHCNDIDVIRRLQSIMDTCGKSLSQFIGHSSSEKCRRLSLECIHSLLLAKIDIARHLPCLMPAILSRFTNCGYDKDMEVFIRNQHTHDFFKRGGAAIRQDRNGLINHVTLVELIEPDEDLRFSLCCTIKCLVGSAVDRNAVGMLEPYCSELIMGLQTSLKDPYAEVKIAASHLLAQLLRITQFESRAKYFAIGLARAALPNCRSRNTAVIVAAIDLLEASITVPDKAKVRGAGSAAVADLVGFKDQHAIPIAAFYDSQYAVSVNVLAELSSHRNPRVRLRCCQMMQTLLIDLPDRYEHEQRLLPYVLLFISDTAPQIQQAALTCIDKCGEQYERDHSDEIMERRQLGVDGDETVDYDTGLPEPFTSRPSLGARLFVRNNTSRFYLAVLGELSSWKAETRLRSAELLLVLTVFCEEHLTKDLHSFLNNLVKTIDTELSSHHDHGHLKILEKIEQVLCLMAKFVDPAAYLKLVRPRMLDGSFPMQRSFIVMLSFLILGSPLHRLLPSWIELFCLVSPPKCIGAFADNNLTIARLKALRHLVDHAQFANEKEISLAQFVDSSSDLSQALTRCVGAIEELQNDSGDESILALSKDCLNKLQAFRIISSENASC